EQGWWKAVGRLQGGRRGGGLREGYGSNAEAWLGASPPGLGAQMRKKVTQITEDAALPPVYPQQPRHSLARRGYGHDLDFRQHGRPALRSSRCVSYAVVDIRAGVRRSLRPSLGRSCRAPWR